MTANSDSAGFDPTTLLANLPDKPGVYQMLDKDERVIYVGKARNLKKRVRNYFRGRTDSPKTAALVKQIQNITVTITQSENEALILECNLIKELHPRYNILLRDDKSYPYIYCSTKHKYPLLDTHRGVKNKPGRYFGPFPSVGAVRNSLNFLQKLFKIRQCSDTFFSHRSRPCLQYQIERCTAPCVGYITEEQYKKSVQHALLFLEGKNAEIISDLVQQMEAASLELDYELAAEIRDQIASLRRVQEQQAVAGNGGDVDVIAGAQIAGKFCVQVLSVRQGRVLGHKNFFPKAPANSDMQDVLSAFTAQYYLNASRAQIIPQQIIINQNLMDQTCLQAALAERQGNKVKILYQVRGQRARWLEMAISSANYALKTNMADQANAHQRLQALSDNLQLVNIASRLECFDISHSQGEKTVASCVVFDEAGPVKSDYRRFNITGITAGDDYAAMKQALTRRYARLKRADAKLPEIVIVDGGKGQLKQAQTVLEELQISEVILLGIAKAPGRKDGLEKIFVAQHQHITLIKLDALAFHLIQQIRDEAHRFAITGHRQRRDKARKSSRLEDIPGVGAKRRRELLRQFGGLQELKKASVLELTKVKGISKKLAEVIFATLHG